MADLAQASECACYNPQAHYTVFEEKPLGTASKHYGDVSLLTCQHCQGLWLHFLLEYETFTGSGRYYRGLISQDIADRVTPDTAVAVLESLDWCIYGGSYFRHAGLRSEGPLKVQF